LYPHHYIWNYFYIFRCTLSSFSRKIYEAVCDISGCVAFNSAHTYTEVYNCNYWWSAKIVHFVYTRALQSVKNYGILLQ
jgi:hypothetical protein